MFQRHDAVGAHCFNCVIRQPPWNHALTQQHGTSCIFLTAQVEHARNAKDAALGVIAKPYDPPKLLQAVEVAAAIRKGETPAAVPQHLELFH